VRVHFGGLADAAGGLGDGVYEQALDLGGSRLLDDLGNGQMFLGDVVEFFVDRADLFNDEGGYGDG
jgi:hypothetical protein